ncbi:MAG TPA: hypothetical protein VKB50_30000 [Vicinamibacterales bacterium]|nr:hypothetical protein [Vicinamibacterales bacterium]
MKRGILAVLVCSASALCLAQAKQVTLTFASQNKNQAFDAATDEYRRMWDAEGRKIIEAMERISALKFPEKRVEVEVYEGVSFAGLRIGKDGNPVGTRGPVRMRASYQADVKKGSLIHELGHRMNVQLRKRPKEIDDHRLLFLYLYDLYEDLYGKEFADGQVAFGRTLKGLYDYDGAWTWALAMNRQERLSKFGEVVKANRK